MEKIRKQIRQYDHNNRLRWTYSFESEIINEILTNTDSNIIPQTTIILSELEQFITEFRQILKEK